MYATQTLYIWLLTLVFCVTHANLYKELGIRATTCASPLVSHTQCTSCTLTQWTQKIFSLKERPIRYSTLPRPTVYRTSILTLDELLHTLEQCTQVYKQQLGNNTQWLDKQSLVSGYPQLFILTRQVNLNTIASNFLFKPYAQRLLVPTGSQVIFFGDLHGSIHSLMRDLLKLKQLGMINDQFQLTTQATHMVFLGDYTDRGIYGTECLYTLARLKIANPEHVTIIRGNHEDYMLQARFEEGYYKLPEKDRAPSFLLELRYKFNLSKAQEIILNRINDLFPVVLYLGCEHEYERNFIQCCHGGLELGYNPQKLLKAPSYIKFEQITLFARKTHFRQLSVTSQQELKTAFDIDALCAEIQDRVFPSPYFKLPHNQRCYTGFMWDDFYIDPRRTIGHRDEEMRGWVWGRNFTHELLSWSSSKTAQLRAILRGHQHNNETGGPMLDLLCCNHGLVNVWSDSRVFTFVSAPDAKLAKSGEECYTYDSFAILTLHNQFNKWRFEHYYQDQGFMRPVWHHQTVFFTGAAQRQTRTAYTQQAVLHSSFTHLKYTDSNKHKTLLC
jgi:hypothetical protein